MLYLKGKAVQDVEHLDGCTKFLDRLAVVYSSSTARCPNEATLFRGKPVTHNAKKIDSFAEYTISDVVNDNIRKPARVAFKVQKWKCEGCYKTFIDPGFRRVYPMNTKTTEDFREYIVLQFLSQSRINIGKLARAYEVTDLFVESAIRDYATKLRGMYRIKPPCSVVWLYQFDYHRSEYVIAYGLTRKSRGEEDLVILGITDTTIPPLLISDFSIDQVNPDFLYVNNEELADDLDSFGEYQCKYENYRDKNNPYLKEIARINEVIEYFEDTHVRYDMMTFRIEFQNRYRRREVQNQGYGSFMPSTVSFYVPGLRKTTTNYERESIKTVDYDATDVKLLLESFDFNEFVGEDDEAADFWEVP